MEKKYVRFVSDKSETTYGVVLPNGKIVSVWGNEDPHANINYDTHFNIETGEIDNSHPLDGKVWLNLNWGYKHNDKHFPTVQCYDLYDVDYGCPKSLNDAKIEEIVTEFAENGFNLDKEDVRSLFLSWQSGWKTGIRNEERGYHLFCPCGGNPFCVRATTLHPKCADWQITYQC